MRANAACAEDPQGIFQLGYCDLHGCHCAFRGRPCCDSSWRGPSCPRFLFIFGASPDGVPELLLPACPVLNDDALACPPRLLLDSSAVQPASLPTSVHGHAGAGSAAIAAAVAAVHSLRTTLTVQLRCNVCACNTVCPAAGRCEPEMRFNYVQDKSEKLQLRVAALERATVQQEAALHKLGRLSHRHIEVSMITLRDPVN